MFISGCLLGVTVLGMRYGWNIWRESLNGKGGDVSVAIMAPAPEDSTFQTRNSSNLPPLAICNSDRLILRGKVLLSHPRLLSFAE